MNRRFIPILMLVAISISIGAYIHSQKESFSLFESEQMFQDKNIKESQGVAATDPARPVKTQEAIKNKSTADAVIEGIREGLQKSIGKLSGGPCESNINPVFSHHLTDVSKINNIVIPPNIIAGDLKTHSYMETDHARVPIYAPTAMTLMAGSYYVSGPYRLDFRVSCEVTVRFAHITEPIEAIRSVFPSTPAPMGDSRDQSIKNKISFNAGDLIGYTTGTDTAGNWDFGVYNSSVRNKYADDARFDFSRIYTTAVCPYDYFSAELKSSYRKKYNARINSGAKPDGESFCK